MALDGLIEALERDTAARLAEIRADARARVAALEQEPVLPPLPPPPDDGLADVRHEARRTVLEARARLLDRVRRAALDAVPETAMDVRGALAYVDGPAETCEGGLVVASDGSVTVDCSLASRVDAAFPGLARAVLDRLGEPP